MAKVFQVICVLVILVITFCLGLLYSDCVTNGKMFKFVFVASFSVIMAYAPAITVLYFTIKKNN